MPCRIVIGGIALLLFMGHGEDPCESGGAACHSHDGYSTVLLQADIRMQKPLQSDLASSDADPFIVELGAQANDMCNKEAKLSAPVHPRKFVLDNVEKDKCAKLAHQGLWEPPEEWGEEAERNWCWGYIKEKAMTYYGIFGRWPTWLWSQEQAARDSHAPDPGTLNLQPLLNHELCDRTTDDNWHLPGGINRNGDERDSALNWFNKHVDVYVLNMPQDTERLETISAHMSPLGIQFTRIDGISLSKPGEMAAAQDKGSLPQNWSFDKQAAENRKLYKGTNLTLQEDQVGLGTAACTAAHLNAMNIASQSRKPLALILEDDARLDSQFLQNIKRLLYEEAPCDWEVINLHLNMAFGECVSSHLARVHPDGNEPEETCRQSTNWSFAAVLYKVSKLRKVHEELWKVVWDTSRPRCNIHDMAFASIADKFKYYGVPTSLYPGLVDVEIKSSTRLTENRVPT
eukprot:TRINITY_DN110939_c0_g1_i1.p1 TRINITY_DN110939_c0_g1~~TRINITY_DN110939_c0_g1_i1.p1  ORF type:complete len:458 (-),score=66.45 TRINITY_DN110939_c0_g1_i1:197-1570(-)